MIFYKDVAIVLMLSAAVALHIVAAIWGYLAEGTKLSKIFNTGANCLGILLHIALIVVMMYKGLALEEAVLVILISVFLHTLASYIVYTVSEKKKKVLRSDEDGGDAA